MARVLLAVGRTTVRVALTLAASAALAERVPFSVPLETRGYERIGSEDGVVSYLHGRKDAVALAAEGELPAPPEEVMRMLLDYEAQIGRVARLSQVRVLERRPDSLLVYQRLDVPVIKDRDYNLLVRWGEADAVRWIEFHAVEKGGVPPRKGAVRVGFHEGSWQLAATAGGTRTRARFQSAIDLAGLVPTWLVRKGAADELPSLFDDFRRLLAARAAAGGGRS